MGLEQDIPEMEIVFAITVRLSSACTLTLRLAVRAGCQSITLLLHEISCLPFGVPGHPPLLVAP